MQMTKCNRQRDGLDDRGGEYVAEPRLFRDGAHPLLCHRRWGPKHDDRAALAQLVF